MLFKIPAKKIKQALEDNTTGPMDLTKELVLNYSTSEQTAAPANSHDHRMIVERVGTTTEQGIDRQNIEHSMERQNLFIQVSACFDASASEWYLTTSQDLSTIST